MLPAHATSSFPRMRPRPSVARLALTETLPLICCAVLCVLCACVCVVHNVVPQAMTSTTTLAARSPLTTRKGTGGLPVAGCGA